MSTRTPPGDHVPGDRHRVAPPQGRTAVKNIESCGLEAVEDSHAAEPRGAKLVAEPAANGVGDRPAGREQVTCTSGDIGERRLPRRRHASSIEIAFVGASGLQECLGHVDATFLPVALDILPEVRQLQRRADGIGPFITTWIAIPRNPQHQTADGVGRSPGVVEDILPLRVPLHEYVLLECAQEVVEQGHLQLERPHCRRQRREDVAGVGTVALDATRGGVVETLPPFVEQFEAAIVSVAAFVSEVVGDTGEGIDGRDVRPRRFRQQFRGDWKILVVLTREAQAGGVCRVGYHSDSRTPAR